MQVTYANPEFFDVLEVRPVHGRLFTEEDGAGAFIDNPVLLSHDLWRSRYGADPGLVGRTITLSDRARRVVGVLPPGFGFPRRETEIWMLSDVPSEARARFAGSLDYHAVGRLRAGVSAASAAIDLERTLLSIEGVYADATA